ncbi:MAG TPA: hypothetical protein DDW23_02225 [Planctomycetes bacterium]|nr:hypothetical protein [Planctomycetota bacterium]
MESPKMPSLLQRWMGPHSMILLPLIVAGLQSASGLPDGEDLHFPGEKHFGSIRRLTAGGENAEGYFSWSGDQLVYQATFGEMECDQVFSLDLLTGARRRISTGTGRCTCAFWMPEDRGIIFASTHGDNPNCPPAPDYSGGYVWKIYPGYDLWVRDFETGSLTSLAPAPGYDAEAVVSPDGQWIAFTSMRSGDLEVWIMKPDGTGLKQLTNGLGYDGGPFFSPDSSRIVYRSWHPKSETETARYKTLLDQNSIEPMALQIRTMDLKGNQKVQVTNNEAANFAPYFHPDGRRIIFSSNLADPKGRNFDLYLIGDDGKGLERVTTCPSFDGFPMFSRDAKRLVFASNRANAKPRDTNLFLAEWIEVPSAESTGLKSPVAD